MTKFRPAEVQLVRLIPNHIRFDAVVASYDAIIGAHAPEVRTWAFWRSGLFLAYVLECMHGREALMCCEAGLAFRPHIGASTSYTNSHGITQLMGAPLSGTQLG
jgi:hypothetical protein